MRTLVAALVTIAVAPMFAQQPASAPATLTLRGVVTTANDVPLPRVRVGVVGAASQLASSLGVLVTSERGVLTDDRGQFTIRVPATASIRLAFTKARYTARTADIPLRETDPASEIRVRMSLGGAISGQVLDRSGAGLMAATVELQRAGAAPSNTPIATMRTNDLGEYRFGGLAEGRYVVTARPSPFALAAILADPQAKVDAAAVDGPTIDVSAGVEVGNIDLTIDTPSELDRDAARRPDDDPEATGSLSGRVVRWDGVPLARAVVHAYRPFIPGRQVETDARGRYRIDGLSTGEYIVEARKYGFDRRQYGQERGATIGRRVAVKNGQGVDSIDVTLTLERSGVIAGTIVDEFGEPAQDVVVGALEIPAVAGQRVRTLGSARTDDRGRYRIFGLPAATYVVQAVVGDTLPGATGYLPVFYPGTFSIDQATSTKVDENAAVTGIDLTLVPTAAHRVTGRVYDSSGNAARGSVVLTPSQRSGALQTEQSRTEIGADGSFEFANVAAGDYAVQASAVIRSTGPDGRALIAEQQFGMSYVTVTASDPPSVQLRLSPGATLRGRVSYEGVPPGPAPILDLALVPTDRDRAPLVYNAFDFSMPPDGSFERKGVFGPTVFRAQPQRNDWYLKSVVVKGQDVTDTPFDFGTGGTFSDIQILISAFGATVAGRVTDDRGAPARTCTVLVFSTLRDRWFGGSRWVKAERTSDDGTFTATGLPPGEYWVAAIERRDPPTPDPDLLESLSSRATRITLGEGQSQDLTLRLIRR